GRCRRRGEVLMMRAAALLLAGCFGPRIARGLPCTSWCPPPETCGEDGFCGGGPGLDGSAMPDGSGLPETNLIFTTSLPVFVPSTYSSVMLALSGADAACQTIGETIRPGTYGAWIGTTGQSPGSRSMATTGWVRPDGMPVATNPADFDMGQLYYPPRID